jgi:flavin reductase (DIM6/NTAB) family NADH-FMN oxidoreductase RutF
MKKSLGAQVLAYPTPTWVVGSYDRQGKPNVMTAAWGGICCSKPPCVAVSLRKATYSYQNLIDRKAFTINVPTETQVKQADYFGLASGRDTDKFAATGLTPVRADHVDAPYIQEFLFVLQCKVVHVIELGLHTQFVGEILDVNADPSILDSNGMPDAAKLKPIVYAPGTKRYHGLGPSLGQGFDVGKEI